MDVIKDQQWEKLNSYNWDDLDTYQWWAFRFAMMEMEGNVFAQGVNVETSNAEYDSLFEVAAHGVTIEQSRTTFTAESEMLVDIIVSDRDYYAEMINYLPWFERDSSIFLELMNVYANELRKLEQEIQMINRNLFIDSSIEMLDLIERDLGIENTSKLDFRQRREQIKGRYRAVYSQTTDDTIRNIADAYSNGKVEINNLGGGIFEIEFVSDIGIPDNIESLKESIEIVIPAHLEIRYSYIFNAWEFFKEKTWEEFGNVTWGEMRSDGEVML